MARSEYTGRVSDDGRELSFDDGDRLRAFLAAHPGRDIDILVRVATARSAKARRMPQLRYYWSVVVPTLAEYCGYERDEMHRVLRWRHLDDRSTTDLSDEEMSDYIERVSRWAAVSLDCYIPPPRRTT